ncbi:MAG: hemolysin family protein [Desulfobacteraceae bacterium]|nr:hemolysin family protein [Desulfobacteraceae bacterium]MCF8094831.1 hemolysin family protein [Desulfobacteraceae bacterium]
MTLLFFYLVLALGVSFLCSVMESVLLSITPSFTAAFEEVHPKTGAQLRRMKTDIDRPLAAILSLNTIAHTVGAAGVGAQAATVFGSQYVGAVSAVLTFLILILSEIIPKTIGALYWRSLARPTVIMLRGLIFFLYPLVQLSQLITYLFYKGKKIKPVTRDEIRALADLGFEEGLFLEKESRILKNLMRFGSIMAADIMTPRKVMFTLPEDMPIKEVYKMYPSIHVSRIPLYESDKKTVRKYILKDDLLIALATDDTDRPVSELGRELLAVPDTVNLFRLFEQLLDRREHIALVVDEYGGVAGLVTMEDILETLLGTEIIDETDTIPNMRKWARKQWYERARSQGLISGQEE